MYNRIVNPLTNRKVDINGTLGKQVLINYFNMLTPKTGGTTCDPSVGVEENGESLNAQAKQNYLKIEALLQDKKGGACSEVWQLASIGAELEKPLDASDVANEADAVAEVKRLRLLLARQKAARFLFDLWDSNASGFLETHELNAVLALYNGLDFDKMSDEEKKKDIEGFMSFYDDHGKADGKLDYKEFYEWLQEETSSFPGDAFTAIVNKLTELIRANNLFLLWDHDKSGFLEVKELYPVMAAYNGLDWATMSEEDKKAETSSFLGYYDDNGEPDGKLDRKEFCEWLREEIMSLSKGDMDGMNAVHQKLTELVGERLKSKATASRPVTEDEAPPVHLGLGLLLANFILNVVLL